jgi:hypothetical protein
MAQDEKIDEDERQAEELFERTVRWMLTTPPKPQEEMKVGKPRRAATDDKRLKPAVSGKRGQAI